MIPLLVLGVTLAVTVVLVAANLAFGAHRPLDTEQPERWLVRHAPASWRPFVRHVDRRIIGGAAIAASLVIVAVGGVVVGTVFDAVDNERGIANWDESAAEWGKTHATDASTTILKAITQLGGTLGLLVILVSIGAVIYLQRRTWGPVLYLLVIGLGVAGLNNILKYIVDRDRPTIAQLAGHSGSSFPSGHSAAAAACWAAIALVVFRRSSRRTRAIGAAGAVFIAVAVAATRVLLGVHWLTDVIAGVVVGWSWFGLVTLVFGGRLLRLGEPAERLARGGDEPRIDLDTVDVPDLHPTPDLSRTEATR